MTKTIFSVIESELDGRIKKLEPLVGRYDNTTLIDKFYRLFLIPRFKKASIHGEPCKGGGKQSGKSTLGLQRHPKVHTPTPKDITSVHHNRSDDAM